MTSVPLAWGTAVALALTLLSAPVAAQERPPHSIEEAATTCPAPEALTDGLEPPLAIVRYLAADALKGRLAGSAGERCAADYLAERFRALGLEPAGRDGGYFQEVPLESAVNPHVPRGTGRNVIGVLRGRDASSDEVLVIGAHYDHLGRGGFGSVNPEDAGQIHNGADDNASGVAALLGVAERLAEPPGPRLSIVFVAFTGEEFGLLGSGRYVDAPAVPLDRTRAMLNLDMVGRLEGDPLIVYGVGTADEWEHLVSEAATIAGVEIRFREEGYGPSDQTSFYARDIPVLHFFTNVHGDYHRPGDDWQKIDVEGIRRVTQMVARIARRVADRAEGLTVRTGLGTPPHARAGEEEGGYGAYLGTVPDFTPVERGVLLSGVTDGSPADAAGLEAGDIIIGLGGRELRDLQAFADALRVHGPGDTVEVRILRDGDELALTAVLGRRGG